jgi:hypothetical protein
MNHSLPYLNFTANCFHSHTGSGFGSGRFRNSDLRNRGAGSVKNAYGSGTLVTCKKNLFRTANVLTRQIFGKGWIRIRLNKYKCKSLPDGSITV